MNDIPWSVWIGFDSREVSAFAVCRRSIRSRSTMPIPVYAVLLGALQRQGLYHRKLAERGGRRWDVISDAPMSTEFAISRFLVPVLAKRGRKAGERAGWALFMDCDILVRDNLAGLFESIQHRKEAALCVQHHHEPPAGLKMDGQEQTRYARKNWSSFMLFNCDHPANALLTVEVVNTVPGRDLHRFFWLEDREIGAIDPAWNWLVGHSDPAIEPKAVHFTEGGPWMAGYEDVPYAEEWRAEFERWASQSA